jgi:D-3-phosphoglycerate dehydrogenase / 2-oxoglutarate reductase
MTPKQPEARFVIFIPEPFPERSVQLLGPQFEVRQGRAGAAYSEAELIDALSDVHAIAINSRDPVTARVIETAPCLKVIAKAGSKPMSNVDFAAAARRGVRVIWTPGANAVSVAEMTLAMMLNVAKRLPEAAAHLTAGGWRTYELLGSELAGKTLGLLGLGAVGVEVARRFRAFDGRVIGYDPRVSTEQASAMGIERVELAALFANSDILSLHCEQNAQTAGIINAAAIAAMKHDAILINTARGGLVDEDALLAALNAGRLRGAALDVFGKEPVAKGNALIAHPRIFATPHFSAFTHEASFRETSWALQDMARVLEGLEPLHLPPEVADQPARAL